MRHLFPLSFLFPIPVFSLTTARSLLRVFISSTTIIECVSERAVFSSLSFVMIKKLYLSNCDIIFLIFFLYKNSWMPLYVFIVSSWIAYWYCSNFFMRNSRNFNFLCIFNVSFAWAFRICILYFFHSIRNCNSDSSSIIRSRGNYNSRQMTSLVKLFEWQFRYIFSELIVWTSYDVYI